MQEVFEKIINELEILKQQRIATVALHNSYESDHTAMIEFNILKDITDWIGKVSEEYNNGWIPVSERLPESNKPVLCWVKSTTIASGETYIIGSCDNGYWFLQTYEIGTNSFPVKDYKVVAWQPLPEPYQPKGE